MVEKWLLQVQYVMIRSLKDVMAEAVEAYPKVPRKQWVLDWPGQVVIAASSIYWTEEVNEAITNGTMKVCNTDVSSSVCMSVCLYLYLSI